MMQSKGKCVLLCVINFASHSKYKFKLFLNTHSAECPRMSAHIVNIFAEKINGVRRYSFHHMKQLLRKFFPHLSPFHCTLTWAPFVACTTYNWCSDALKLMHAHSYVRSIEEVSYVTLWQFCYHVVKTVLFWLLFIFSIKMFKMCTLIPGHPVYSFHVRFRNILNQGHAYLIEKPSSWAQWHQCFFKFPKMEHHKYR
jgi:hypothetical protein